MTNIIKIKSNGWIVTIEIDGIILDSIGKFIAELMEDNYNWAAFKIGNALWYDDGQYCVYCHKTDGKSKIHFA